MFEALRMINIRSILVFPDYSKMSLIDINASDTEIGAVLLQALTDSQDHAIDYSCPLSGPEHRYCTTHN